MSISIDVFSVTFLFVSVIWSMGVGCVLGCVV